MFVVIKTENIMQRACALIVTINMVDSKSLLDVLMKSFMHKDCVKIVILILITIKED